MPFSETLPRQLLQQTRLFLFIVQYTSLLVFLQDVPLKRVKAEPWAMVMEKERLWALEKVS
ncbi:hypothetical protein AC478_01715 [miscellaneous Crenarchaeota group-1 archaeon SG8-32-3]|uniref:Uncharacterized protein n=1 Tax=miscellaneous Crenarchaeota group-1 archaeon SG8-32-3 TaxID=1685125 RepID=A0A0M0BTM6_9ARCH|nr:MAG: hypothetical protein AC478_01715 [miscellaneous Crenarchaeota group-1 archaeon SG8-32-3]